MALKIFVDTNVLLDYLLIRKPFESAARKIVNLCQEEIVSGAISPGSIADMFYIMRKDVSEHDRREMLLALCDIFHIEGMDGYKIISALQNDSFHDFEDCLQMECALSFGADYIITRDLKHFTGSVVSCMEPDKFCDFWNHRE